MAFLLGPDYTSPMVQELQAWIDSQKSAGRMVVALNLRHHIPGGSEAETDNGLRACFDAIKELPGVSKVALLLIPHDFRGDRNDHHLNKLFEERYRNRLPPCRIVNPPFTSSEGKTIVGLVDVLITGRTHFAIAAGDGDSGWRYDLPRQV